MARNFRSSPWLSALALLVLVFPGSLASADDHDRTARDAFHSGSAPTDLFELRRMQTHIEALTERLIASTVSVQVNRAHGSGVIISSDGYVLTAAHVAGAPNLRAMVRLHDGRSVPATTLGVFRTVDAGLVKIDARAGTDWPAVPMGNSRNLRPGDWCLATGHPGGFQTGRGPSLRVGRVLDMEPDAIQTDCPLIGGDSGGPLFNSDGHVVGIHSRIGKDLAVNLHVPVNEFRISWNRLAAGEAWGELPGSDQLTDPNGDRRRGRRGEFVVKPFLGVRGDAQATDSRISEVIEGTPAEQAGLQAGDVILRFDDQRVGDFDSLIGLVAATAPGDFVTLLVRRESTQLTLHAKIGKQKVLKRRLSR